MLQYGNGRGAERVCRGRRARAKWIVRARLFWVDRHVCSDVTDPRPCYDVTIGWVDGEVCLGWSQVRKKKTFGAEGSDLISSHRANFPRALNSFSFSVFCAFSAF